MTLQLLGTCQGGPDTHIVYSDPALPLRRPGSGVGRPGRAWLRSQMILGHYENAVLSNSLAGPVLVQLTMVKVDLFLVQKEMLKHLVPEWCVGCFSHLIFLRPSACYIPSCKIRQWPRRFRVYIRCCKFCLCPEVLFSGQGSLVSQFKRSQHLYY